MAQRTVTVLVRGRVVKPVLKQGQFENDQKQAVSYDFVEAKCVDDDFNVAEVRFPKDVKHLVPKDQGELVELRCEARTTRDGIRLDVLEVSPAPEPVRA